MTDTKTCHRLIDAHRHAMVNVIKIASDDVNFVYEIGAEIISQLSQVFFRQC